MKHLLLVVAFALVLPGALHAQESDDLDELLSSESNGSETGPPGADSSGADVGAEPSSSADTGVAPEQPADQDLDLIPVQIGSQGDSLSRQQTARQIEEIVVTAQKIEQSVQKVPISLTAFSGDSIKESGAADLADVSLYVPNVRVDADDLGSPQVFIRGFGTNAFNPSFESSVGLVQDEIYFGRPGYFTEAMFDIDRVEVLRGPQGTLFGKNTIAGVFNITSKGPDPDAPFSADASYFHGEGNERRFEGGVGGMFADWAGARLGGLYRSQDGELYNQFLDRDEEQLKQKAARLKLRVFAGADVDSEMTAVVSDTEAPFWPFQLFKLDDDTRAYLRGFDPDVEDDPYNFRTSFDTPGFIEKGSRTVSLKTQWGIGELGPMTNFNSVLVLGGSTFYIDQLNELDVSPADIARLDNHEDHRQFSTELRFTGSADDLFGIGEGLDFVAGGFYFDSQYTLLARVLAGEDLGSYLLTRDFCQLSPVNTNVPNACTAIGALPLPGVPPLGIVTSPLTADDYYRFDYTQDIESLALFGQVTWQLTERWAITPGVRLNKEKKRVDTAGTIHCTLREETGRPCVMEQLLNAKPYDLRDQRREEFDVSPKFAVQYFGEDDINYYASYARGYKSGGFNSISFTGEDLEYEAEKAQTVELGVKARFLDRSLNFNATLYGTRFDNLQVLAFNSVFFDVSNAAAANSRGLEADFLWLTPYEPLQLAGSFGLLDARYDRYPAAPAPVSQGIGTRQDLSGKRIAFAPRQSATLTPTLSYSLGNLLGSFAVDVLYQGDQFTDTDLDPNTHVDAYTKYAARLILASVTQGWSFSIGGTNLTDKRVLNQVTDATFFPGTYFVQQASGRQLFAVLSLRI
jgi:outer membrane receptor protein involved in Fe transport